MSAADSTAEITNEGVLFAETSALVEPISLTTAGDMARYFQLMLTGQLIDAYVSQEIATILERQVVDDRIPYLLPPGTATAHKTGNLDHVTHDVGVIVTPNGPVILIAMTEDTPDDDHATQLIQRLSLIAYGDFDIPPFTEQAVMPVGSPQASPDASPVEASE